MSIVFNNIPDTIRTPGAYTEIDNSRALQGLVANPHKVLIIGQKTSSGSASVDVVKQITSDGLADGFFGVGSILARMCNVFKQNNPNTELHALALSISAGGVKATGTIKFDSSYSATADCNYYLMINGVACYVPITSAWSVTDVCSAIAAKVNSMDMLPVVASVSASAAGSNHVNVTAKISGSLGNYINIRANYYVGQSNPAGWSVNGITYASMASGSGAPELDEAWAVVAGTQYHHIIQPYNDATNLTSLENELEDRFGPLIDLQGHGYVGARGTQAELTTLGNARNSPHNTIIGAYDSPNSPEEWAAAMGAVAAWNLNNDPARPLFGLKLKGILAPPEENRFTRAERDILLYDGIATWICDVSGNVLLERLITTYQTNLTGSIDPSYLDICTLFTLMEIRYQYKARMTTRFIIPRFKLADDTFPVQPGSYVVTPKTVKSEIIALFAELQEDGLIENLEDFKNNLVVQRNSADKTRVDVILPPDLVNQFNIIASVIQFIL